MNSGDQCRKQIDDLLNLPHQNWLLGAGVSCESGMPLMYPLTEQVKQILQAERKKDFQVVRSQLPQNSHVEHVFKSYWRSNI